jgi:DNA polymerase III subunit epsilon
MVSVALRDHLLTDRERYDLEMVADALGVTELDALLTQSESSRSPSIAAADRDLQGKTVCFTGKLLCRYEGEPLTRSAAERLAEEAGLSVLPRVTKSLDILVIADPDSMSGKAKKARDYGTRVIAEASFWPLIGVEVS